MIARDRHGCELIGARCGTLAEKFDLPIFRGTGRYLMGWAKAQGLTLSEGVALMEEAFPFVVNPSYKIFYKFFGAALAEARFNAGRVTDALALVDHAVNAGEGPAWGLFVPEIHRLRGVFLTSLGSPVEEVERALHTALQIADEQGALLVESPHRDEPRASLARPGQAAAGSRTARASVRLVHRRLRHA
jgi:predicted ATPase